MEAKGSAVGAEGLRNIRLMTFGEIDDELMALDERRRLLMRAKKLLIELNAPQLDNGRPPEVRR